MLVSGGQQRDSGSAYMKNLKKNDANELIYKTLEGLMLKLKLQYFGHLMRRADSLEKTLMLGKIEGGRRKDDRG